MCRELTTVFRMSLSTSLWPVSWSVKEPVWRHSLQLGAHLSLSVLLSTTLYYSSLPDLRGKYLCRQFVVALQILIYRRGHYRGSLPRHPPPGQKRGKLLEKKATPTKSEATPTKSEATTPTMSEATPTMSEATPPEVSVSGGADSNKTEESEVDSVTGPSCFLCEGPCDITFQPCGHTAMCAECAQPVKRCPICKVS